jgi:hypothetical protein
MEISSRIFGWLLLIAGIAVIGWVLISSYNIFTAKAELPEFFEIGVEEGALNQTGAAGELTPENIQSQMQQMIGEQIQGLLPVDTIPKLLNLAVWSILAGLLIFGGAQIAGLGIKLIKK